MSMHTYHFSTGLSGLDGILRGLLAGDNIVWRIDSVEDYQALVTPYVDHALARSQPVVYFRFADHPALLPDHPGIRTHTFRPEEGFETFVSKLHQAIRETGRGACYVFDCISHLADVWYSDEMLGNFFKLTCPYLFDLETLAYFALIPFRRPPSSFWMSTITSTTTSGP
jgi:hypothetical protein